MTHTITNYNKGCRCDVCVEARRQYDRDRRRAARLLGVPATVTHGKVSTYKNYGCRCNACKSAMSAASRDAYQASKQPKPTGFTF